MKQTFAPLLGLSLPLPTLAMISIKLDADIIIENPERPLPAPDAKKQMDNMIWDAKCDQQRRVDCDHFVMEKLRRASD